MEKTTKENLDKIKDIVIFALLLLWMLMPVLQSMMWMYKLIKLNTCYFGLMKIIGVIGIAFGIYYIFMKIKKAENKKDVLKGLIPIFIFIIYLLWTLVSCYFAQSKRLAFEGSNYRK